MPRALRVNTPGAIYHITCRGNRKQPIFLEANDHVFHFRWLSRVAGEAEWEVFSLIHMTNHFHLLVRPPKPNLSHGMQRLNGLYGQFFNDAHAYSGHLFQGRFHSRLVETETHLLECARYDALNPVRAGLVDHPLDWRWGSLRATLGLAPRPDFLRYEWLLEQYGRTPEEARSRFLEFVEEGFERQRVA